MAGIAYVRKRVYNPELIVDPDGVLPMNLRQSNIKGYNPIYYIKWVGGTQAGEELGTAKTATKDGTTTPYLVNVVSSSLLDDYDDVATSGVRSTAVVGPSVSSVAAYTAGEIPLVTIEVIRTNGTADVLSTRYFLWTDAFYAVQWGPAEEDAEGNIDLEAPTGTVQIRILAGQNEGEGGQWHFPPNRRLFVHSVDINTTAALAAGDGVVLTNTCTSFDKTNNIDPDLEVDYYTYVHNNQGHKVFKPASPIGRYTTVNSSCVWSEALVANTQTISLEIVQYLDRGEG